MLSRFQIWRVHRALKKIGIPEIDVAPQCPHGCYHLKCISPVVWRFAGSAPVLATPEKRVLVHGVACDDENNDGCAAFCWGDA